MLPLIFTDNNPEDFGVREITSSSAVTEKKVITWHCLDDDS